MELFALTETVETVS